MELGTVMKKGKQKRLIVVLLSILVAILVGFTVTNIYKLKTSDSKTTYVKQEGSKENLLAGNTNTPTESPVPTKLSSGTATMHTTPTSTPSATAGDGQVYTVSLLAVGDDLIHTQVIGSGRKSNGTYNFDHLYANMKSDIKKADLAVINQETVLGGKSIGYSGYPTFNSPTEIGDALVKAGFNVVLHATNHSMDKGEKGLQNSLNYWKKQKQVTVLGANETKKEQDTVKVVEKNGIKIAMLNYTYGLNGMPLPEKRKYMVDLLDVAKIKKDVAQAKEKADFVIVFPHWGTEYNFDTDDMQEKYTKVFSDAGVDLVIGAHPHVIEPVKWVKGKKGHKMLVYYSLGNFVSGQTDVSNMLGALAKVTIQKDENGKTTIKDASVTPTITHYEYGYSNYSIYKLSDYSTKLANRHKLSAKGFSRAKMVSISKQVFGDWYKG